MEQDPRQETATLAGGCFWCLEAVFSELRGVVRVEPGYTGSFFPDPTYEQVCTGKTGHAEAVRITFDPLVVSFRDLLTVFFAMHDPTTLNRQDGDVGTQYRSAVFYRTAAQRETALAVIGELEAAGAFGAPVKTEVAPLTVFYPAEENHRDYFRRNPGQPYCRSVIEPKVQRLQWKFPDRINDRHKNP